MAKREDRSIEKAKQLVEMIEEVVDHEDLDKMIKLADLHLQVSIAQSLLLIEQDGLWITPR
jgi:hypothetical protein